MTYMLYIIIFNTKKFKTLIVKQIDLTKFF